MENLLKKLKNKLPDVSFEPGSAFYWSPQHSRVSYKPEETEKPHNQWSLLHEVSHAILKHKSYDSDLDLLLMEVAAWQKAKELAADFGIKIDEDYVQDCLDTYRDWLHQRATCPRCSSVSLQVSARTYRCHNCSATWNVSASRFCRPYRLSNAQNKKSPREIPQTTFQ